MANGRDERSMYKGTNVPGEVRVVLCGSERLPYRRIPELFGDFVMCVENRLHLSAKIRKIVIAIVHKVGKRDMLWAAIA